MSPLTRVRRWFGLSGIFLGVAALRGQMVMTTEPTGSTLSSSADSDRAQPDSSAQTNRNDGGAESDSESDSDSTVASESLFKGALRLQPAKRKKKDPNPWTYQEEARNWTASPNGGFPEIASDGVFPDGDADSAASPSPAAPGSQSLERMVARVLGKDEPAADSHAARLLDDATPPPTSGPSFGSSGGPGPIGAEMDAGPVGAGMGGGVGMEGGSGATILHGGGADSAEQYLQRYDSSLGIAAPASVDVSGLNLTMADLGVTSGTTIANYAPASPVFDATPTVTDDFGVDDDTDAGVTSFASYKKMTAGSDAFTAMIDTKKQAPEPGAYAEIFLSAGVALYCWRRTRKQPACA